MACFLLLYLGIVNVCFRSEKSLRLPINIAKPLVIAFMASSVLIAGCSNMSEPIQRAIRPESISRVEIPDPGGPVLTLPESDSMADQGDALDAMVDAADGENNVTIVTGEETAIGLPQRNANPDQKDSTLSDRGEVVIGLPQRNAHPDHKTADVSAPAEVVLFDQSASVEGEECRMAKLQSFDCAGDYNDSVFEKNRRTGIASISRAQADSGMDVPIIGFFPPGMGVKK